MPDSSHDRKQEGRNESDFRPRDKGEFQIWAEWTYVIVSIGSAIIIAVAFIVALFSGEL